VALDDAIAASQSSADLELSRLEAQQAEEAARGEQIRVLLNEFYERTAVAGNPGLARFMIVGGGRGVRGLLPATVQGWSVRPWGVLTTDGRFFSGTNGKRVSADVDAVTHLAAGASYSALHSRGADPMWSVKTKLAEILVQYGAATQAPG
jgi:hypothetical protein